MPEYIERETLRAESLRITRQDEFAFDNCYPWWQFSKCIKEAPAADVVPVVRGEWIDSPNISECVVCSNCMSDGLSAQVIAPAPDWYKFCPCCGAMKYIPHSCECCEFQREHERCAQLPEGDEFSADNTEGFDRDDCEHWELRLPKK